MLPLGSSPTAGPHHSVGCRDGRHSATCSGVIRSIVAARQADATTWALTGSSGGRLGEAAEHVVAVPSDQTARIQELHITVIHAVSELVDAWAASGD